MTLSHSTLVLPGSFVDFVRSNVLDQIRNLYDGKVELRGSGPESLHTLPLTLMDNGEPIHVQDQRIVIHNIQYDNLLIEPENKYSAAGVLAIGYLEQDNKRILSLAMRFRVFLYQEHKPNAYLTAL